MTRCSTSRSRSPDPLSLLSTGEFARRSRLSVKALRLYDRIGLLRPAEVEPGNGYRGYAESQLYAARLIALLRRLDMPLAQIATIVAARGPGAAELLDDYWSQVEQRLARQRELADRLVSSLAGETPPPDGRWPVHTRDVPEQVVLTEQRHVTAAELIWQRAAAARLLAVAGAHGGPAGPRFVIFHDPVGEDLAGAVEVCLPVDGARFDPAEFPLRTEPAHREAYIEVRPGHFEAPLILSIFDAVRSWVRATGYRPTAAPREVHSHAPGAPFVCDVALPFA
jgi:DNA-binding transcriptional MerR regulator